MNYVLFIGVFALACQSIYAADDCKAEKEAVHSCLHAIFADAEEARSKRKAAFGACFTDNNCTHPADAFKEKKAAESKKWECKKNAFNSVLKPKLEGCVRQAIPDFTFPDINFNMTEHHWGGHHRGGHRGGHREHEKHGGMKHHGSNETDGEKHGHHGHEGRRGHDGRRGEGRHGHEGRRGHEGREGHEGRRGHGEHGRKEHGENMCAKAEKFFEKVCPTADSREKAKSCLEKLREDRGKEDHKDKKEKKRQMKECFKNHTTEACKEKAMIIKGAICSCAAEGLGDSTVVEAIRSCHNSTMDAHDEDNKHEDEDHHRKVSRHLVKMFCHKEHHGQNKGHGKHHGRRDD